MSKQRHKILPILQFPCCHYSDGEQHPKNIHSSNAFPGLIGKYYSNAENQHPALSKSEKYFTKQKVRVAAVPEGRFILPQRTEAGNNDNNLYYCNNNISDRISWDALCPHRNA